MSNVTQAATEYRNASKHLAQVKVERDTAEQAYHQAEDVLAKAQTRLRQAESALKAAAVAG